MLDVFQVVEAINDAPIIRVPGFYGGVRALWIFESVIRFYHYAFALAPGGTPVFIEAAGGLGCFQVDEVAVEWQEPFGVGFL